MEQSEGLLVKGNAEIFSISEDSKQKMQNYLTITCNKDGILCNQKQIDEQQPQLSKVVTYEEQLIRNNGIRISLTYKRGNAIGQNIESNTKYEINDIQDTSIDYQLGCKHLNQDLLKTIIINLKKYQMYLDKYLGSGGEADVYLGKIMHNDGHQEEIVFRIILAHNKENIPQIRKEYEKIISIQEPKNVVSYEGLIQIDDNIIIFIMKKYSSSLKDKMTQKFSNQEYLGLMIDLLYGLMELRINNIIHSDIKPGNILVDENQRCYYSDFGLAIKLNNKEEFSNDKYGYTDGYHSPEHKNNQPLSYASDIYSLGQLFIKLSEYLEDQEFENKMKDFVNQKMKQEDPKSRISIKHLFHTLVDLVPKNNILDLFYHLFFSDQNQRDSANYFKKLDDLSNVKGNQLKFFDLKRVYIILKVKVFNEILKLKGCVNISCIEVVIMFIEFAQINELNQLDRIPIKLGFALEILNSISTKSSQVKILYAIIYKKYGDYYNNVKSYQQGIKHYQLSLSNLLQVNLPEVNEQIAGINLLIAMCYYSLGQVKESISLLQKSIAGIQKIQKINHFKLLQNLGNIFWFQNQISSAKKCYQQIVDNWNEDTIEYSSHSDSVKLEFQNVLGFSLYQLEKYVESFKSHIKVFKLYYQEFSVLENSNIVRIILKFTQKEMIKVLEDFQQNEKDGMIKKVVLLDFAEFSLFSQKNVEITNKIIESYHSIKEDIPLSKQVQENIILAELHSKQSNVKESAHFLKQIIQLFKNHDLKVDSTIEEYELYFIIIMADQFESNKQDIDFNPIFQDPNFQKSRNTFLQKKQAYFANKNDESYEPLVYASLQCFQVVLSHATDPLQKQ